MAEEWKAKGNSALQSKDYDTAVECYTKAIELDGNNHVYYSNRSAAYLSKGDAQNALKDADSCVQVNPSWAKGYSRKGAALHSLKRYEDAAAAYREGLQHAPSDPALKAGLEDVLKAEEAAKNTPAGGAGGIFGPDLLVRLAGHPKFGKYLADPDFMRKLQLLQTDPSNATAMLQDPRIMEVFGFLVGMDMKTPEDESAPSSYTPPPPPAPAKKEETPVEEEENEELDEAAKEVKRRKLEAVKAKEKGNKHYSKKEFAEALSAYDEAIEFDPTNMSFLTNKAAVYLEQGKYEETIDQCKKAIELGRANRADYSDIAKAYVRIGKAYTKMDNLDAALGAYKEAQLEHFSKDVERLIKNMELEKKKKDAAAYIDPAKALEAKERGNDFFRAGSFKEAIGEYEEAIKRDPSNAAYRNNLAAALQKVGDFSGAKRSCEKAIELDPKYVKAWAKKGDIEFFMKEYHRAMDSYKKGLEIDPGNSLCVQGLQKTQHKINESMSGEVDQERAAHGLADPEIQRILGDPIMRQILQDLNENPMEGRKALADPEVRRKFDKLIAAGVLKMG